QHMELVYAEQSVEQFVVGHRRSPFYSDGSTSFLLFPLITGEPDFENKHRGQRDDRDQAA
ncbi:MAG: hypothetical protein AB1649_19045, partial [Chloroflexota bacterium]